MRLIKNVSCFAGFNSEELEAFQKVQKLCQNALNDPRVDILSSVMQADLCCISNAIDRLIYGDNYEDEEEYEVSMN